MGALVGSEAPCLTLAFPCYAFDSTSGMGVGPQIHDLKRRILWEFWKKQLARLPPLKA
jgi:hypothetical protein